MPLIYLASPYTSNENVKHPHSRISIALGGECLLIIQGTAWAGHSKPFTSGNSRHPDIFHHQTQAPWILPKNYLHDCIDVQHLPF